MRLAHRTRIAVSFALGIALFAPLSACGGSTTQAMSPAEQDKMRAQERLQGHWRLDSFTPSAPLGPPLDSLLAAQIGQLVLDVDANQVAVTGAGIEATRRCEIVEATPLGAKLQLTDNAGVHFDVEVRFRGEDIDFTSKTAPWQGQGSLSREP
jgi:hypothetical protein